MVTSSTSSPFPSPPPSRIGLERRDETSDEPPSTRLRRAIKAPDPFTGEIRHNMNLGRATKSKPVVPKPSSKPFNPQTLEDGALFPSLASGETRADRINSLFENPKVTPVARGTPASEAVSDTVIPTIESDVLEKPDSSMGKPPMKPKRIKGTTPWKRSKTTKQRSVRFSEVAEDTSKKRRTKQKPVVIHEDPKFASVSGFLSSQRLCHQRDYKGVGKHGIAKLVEERNTNPSKARKKTSKEPGKSAVKPMGRPKSARVTTEDSEPDASVFRVDSGNLSLVDEDFAQNQNQIRFRDLSPCIKNEIILEIVTEAEATNLYANNFWAAQVLLDTPKEELMAVVNGYAASNNIVSWNPPSYLLNQGIIDPDTPTWDAFQLAKKFLAQEALPYSLVAAWEGVTLPKAPVQSFDKATQTEKPTETYINKATQVNNGAEDAVMVDCSTASQCALPSYNTGHQTAVDKAVQTDTPNEATTVGTSSELIPHEDPMPQIPIEEATRIEEPSKPVDMSYWDDVLEEIEASEAAACRYGAEGIAHTKYAHKGRETSQALRAPTAALESSNIKESHSRQKESSPMCGPASMNEGLIVDELPKDPVASTENNHKKEGTKATQTDVPSEDVTLVEAKVPEGPIVDLHNKDKCFFPAAHGVANNEVQPNSPRGVRIANEHPRGPPNPFGCSNSTTELQSHCQKAKRDMPKVNVSNTPTKISEDIENSLLPAGNDNSNTQQPEQHTIASKDLHEGETISNGIQKATTILPGSNSYSNISLPQKDQASTLHANHHSNQITNSIPSLPSMPSKRIRGGKKKISQLSEDAAMQNSISSGSSDIRGISTDPALSKSSVKRNPSTTKATKGKKEQIATHTDNAMPGTSQFKVLLNNLPAATTQPSQSARGNMIYTMIPHKDTGIAGASPVAPVAQMTPTTPIPPMTPTKSGPPVALMTPQNPMSPRTQMDLGSTPSSVTLPSLKTLLLANPSSRPGDSLPWIPPSMSQGSWDGTAGFPPPQITGFTPSRRAGLSVPPALPSDFGIDTEPKEPEKHGMASQGTDPFQDVSIDTSMKETAEARAARSLLSLRGNVDRSPIAYNSMPSDAEQTGICTPNAPIQIRDDSFATSGAPELKTAQIQNGAKTRPLSHGVAFPSPDRLSAGVSHATPHSNGSDNNIDTMAPQEMLGGAIEYLTSHSDAGITKEISATARTRKGSFSETGLQNVEAAIRSFSPHDHQGAAISARSSPTKMDKGIPAVSQTSEEQGSEKVPTTEKAKSLRKTTKSSALKARKCKPLTAQLGSPQENVAVTQTSPVDAIKLSGASQKSAEQIAIERTLTGKGVIGDPSGKTAGQLAIESLTKDGPNPTIETRPTSSSEEDASQMNPQFDATGSGETSIALQATPRRPSPKVIIHSSRESKRKNSNVSIEGNAMARESTQAESPSAGRLDTLTVRKKPTKRLKRNAAKEPVEENSSEIDELAMPHEFVKSVPPKSKEEALSGVMSQTPHNEGVKRPLRGAVESDHGRVIEAPKLSPPVKSSKAQSVPPSEPRRSARIGSGQASISNTKADVATPQDKSPEVKDMDNFKQRKDPSFESAKEAARVASHIYRDTIKTRSERRKDVDATSDVDKVGSGSLKSRLSDHGK